MIIVLIHNQQQLYLRTDLPEFGLDTNNNIYQLNYVLCPRVLQEKCAFRYVLKQNYNRIGFDFRLLPVFPILEIKGADSTEMPT
jgi:hypothetical protein